MMKWRGDEGIFEKNKGKAVKPLAGEQLPTQQKKSLFFRLAAIVSQERMTVNVFDRRYLRNNIAGDGKMITKEKNEIIAQITQIDRAILETTLQLQELVMIKKKLIDISNENR